MNENEKGNRRNIEDFFEKEYATIADAHFNVSQRITSFFQYMLAIYAAPLILFNENIKIANELKGLVFIFIAIVGFFVCMYVNQLRCESLLYARTVNAMRNYSYDKYAKIENGDERYQVLPLQKYKPSFVDTYQFIWIVLTASIVNAGYCIYGISQFINPCTPNTQKWIVLTLIFCVLAIIQIYMYLLFTRRVESGLNMYKQRIGIDIDGVIADHVEQFCMLYNKLSEEGKNEFFKNVEKNICPDQITEIPVHKIEGLNITEDQERAIFNRKEYWERMPEIAKASETIKKIHNTFGLEVYIFSWRDWGAIKINTVMCHLISEALQKGGWMVCGKN